MTSDHPSLERLGWTDELQSWAEESDHLWRGRVAQASRGFCLVATQEGPLLARSASVRATLGIEPSTGDFVTVVEDYEDGPVLDRVASRTSVVTRRAPGRIPEPQILAANADEVLVMHGLDREENVRRIERQLVIAWESGAQPVIVLTKSDVAVDRDAQVEAVSTIAPDVPLIVTSVETGEGLDDLRGRLEGNQTITLIGPSGIGKSTLVNELSGGEIQRVGEVRETDLRGRHTTVTRDLIVLPDEGILLDTPGIRELGLWQAYHGMAMTFPHLTEAASRCRFADCAHEAEPGCAVRELIKSGDPESARFGHWSELSEELSQQEADLEVHAKKTAAREKHASGKRRKGRRR